MRAVTTLPSLLLLALLLWPVAGADARRCPPREDETWTPYRQVTWEDFKGRPTGRMSRATAHILTHIKIDFLDAEVTGDGSDWLARPTDFCLYALMDKYQSAFKPQGKSERTLDHEQLHFDITEYLARKLRVQLRELSARGGSAEEARRHLEEAARRAYDSVMVEWEAMQLRYDRETGNGTRLLRQKRWRRKLDRLLAETSESPPENSE